MTITGRCLLSPKMIMCFDHHNACNSQRGLAFVYQKLREVKQLVTQSINFFFFAQVTASITKLFLLVLAKRMRFTYFKIPKQIEYSRVRNIRKSRRESDE